MITLKRTSIEKLTEALALPATGLEQDWEAELADPSRVSDFLAAYHTLPLTPDDKIALMALMLASADLYIGAQSSVPEEWERIAALLAIERDLHRETIRYWVCEGDEDPEAWFHLTPLVRDVNVT